MMHPTNEDASKSTRDAPGTRTDIDGSKSAAGLKPARIVPCEELDLSKSRPACLGERTADLVERAVPFADGYRQTRVRPVLDHVSRGMMYRREGSMVSGEK